MIIGIDHGYGVIKTAHFSFTTGISEYEKEPYTSKNVVKYQDKYYICGSGRQSLIRDKTADDSYYILTLVAIAKELDYRNAGTKVNISIAAGLPLTGFGRDKEKFTKYLKRSCFQPVRFEFEESTYKIVIDNVYIYPQGYSAIIDYIGKLKNEPSVIVCDIGSWTIDVMRLDQGVPNADTCRSLEHGIIRMIDNTLEQVRRSTGLSVTSAQIEQILKGQPCSMDEKAKTIISEQGRLYADKLFRILNESGFDVAAIPIIFLGGGAQLIKNNMTNVKFAAMSIIDDVKVNAIGYEKIAKLKEGENR